MPAVRAAPGGERGGVLHERDALALDRPRDQDARRSVVVTPERAEGVPEQTVVVPVAGDDAAAERDELRLEALEREDLLGGPVRLELVPVDEDEQPPDPLVRRRLQRLPVLPLLELAVARHHDDAAAAAEMPLRPGDPPRLGDAHAERARVRLDPGDADVGVAVEPSEPAEAQQALRRDGAQRVEGGVEPGHVVPLRGEEDIAVGRVEAELRDVQLLPEQMGDEVQRAEGGAEMPGAGALDRDERVRATHVREEREAVVRVEPGRRDARELGGWDQLEWWHGVDCRSGARGASAYASCAGDGSSLLRGARSPTSAATIHTGTNGSANSLCGACESAWTPRTSAPTPISTRIGAVPRGRRTASATAATAIQRIERGQRSLAVPPFDASQAFESRGRQLRVPVANGVDELAVAPRLVGVAERRLGVGHDASLEVVGRAPDEPVAHRLDERRDGDRRRERLPVDHELGGQVGDRHGPLSRLGRVALGEEVPERLADALDVGPGVGPDRLERGVEESVVVRVPAEHAVGERDHPDHLEVAGALEVRLDVDVSARVGRLRQHLLLDRVREPTRRVAVRGVDVAGNAEEGDPRLAPARHGEVVVAHGVVRRPGGEG